MQHILQVQVANGAQVSCQSHLPQAQREVQGYSFCSDLKILPLKHFSMILGYDWLEQFSPMKIHWTAKWLAIPYGSQTVVLHGILSKLSDGDVVQISQLSEEDLQLDHSDSAVHVSSVLPEIKKLLDVYADIFASRVAFPPPRSCSHSIPLVPEARPFHIRPYIYAPVLKDEIEHQVQEMLQAGLIQHSTNHFSSPVLGRVHSF
jgi:hypothetical protein